LLLCDFEDDIVASPARIGVALPEFFGSVRAGEPVWLDDGKFGGVVSAVEASQVVVHLTHVRPKGAKLGAEKGINAPETDLNTPALTEDDIHALELIVKNADIASIQRPVDWPPLKSRSRF
jgi:pyruvate kinase